MTFGQHLCRTARPADLLDSTESLLMDIVWLAKDNNQGFGYYLIREHSIVYITHENSIPSLICILVFLTHFIIEFIQVTLSQSNDSDIREIATEAHLMNGGEKKRERNFFPGALSRSTLVTKSYR
jgi:hypothetical protein